MRQSAITTAVLAKKMTRLARRNPRYERNPATTYSLREALRKLPWLKKQTAAGTRSAEVPVFDDTRLCKSSPRNVLLSRVMSWHMFRRSGLETDPVLL